MTPDMVEDLPPAKVPILPKDILNSRKAQAVRKEQKRKQGKQRSLGPPMDYSPLPIDKHEPEFVRIPHNTGSIIMLLCRSTLVLSVSNSVEPTMHDWCLTIQQTLNGFLDPHWFVLFFKGSLQEKVRWHHPGNEGHLSCDGSVPVPPKL